MALWNKVQSGFDPDEETVNFGARDVVENNGSIYESTTIGIIQSDRGAQSDPNISSSLHRGKLCVFIDKSLTVFTDDSSKELVLSKVFDEPITSCQVSDEGTMLYVALANGTFHCLYLLDEGKFIFTIKTGIDGKNIKIIRICLQPVEFQRVTIMLVANNGAIYSIPRFNFGQVHYALSHRNDAMLSVLLEHVYTTRIFNGFSKNDVTYVASELVLGTWSIVMVTANSLFIWPAERSHSLSILPYSCKKVQFFISFSAFLCLSSDGTLSIVCPKTFCMKKVHDGHVSDFATIQDNRNSDLQVVILTEPEDSTSRSLRLVSFPDFTEIYKFRVSKTTYLAELTDPIGGNVVFLETMLNEAGETETIKIKSIIESVPERQLDRLMRRQKFAEAEMFADNYDLPLQRVYRERATTILDTLGPWSGRPANYVDIEIFLTVLEKVEDIHFVIDCCNQALVADCRQMFKLLHYARRRVIQAREAMPFRNEEYTRMLCAVDANVKKLSTFEMVRVMKYGLDNTPDEPNSAEVEERLIVEWIEFSRSNILSVYKTNVYMGELECASLIWARHLGEIMEHITAETVTEIFERLPINVDAIALLSWLQNFIPSLVYICPYMMSEVAAWGYQNAISFEKIDPTNWPFNGMQFARLIVELIRCDGSSARAYFNEQCTNHDSLLRKLTGLIQTLSELQQLKNDHGIRVPLDLYVNDPLQVAVMLLTKASVDKIPQLVNKFLDKFMNTYDLHNDAVFSIFIQTTIKNSKSWWCWDVAPWEKKVAVAIGYIENLETRLQRTLEVLKKAPVPWSTTMKDLAEADASVEHALTSQIRAEKNLVAVKLILKKYGYESIGVNDKLIRYVVKQHREDMMQDLLELTKSEHSMKLEAFDFYINYHLCRGNTAEVMQFFNTLEDDIAFYCCEGIVKYVIASLNLKTKNHESMENYIEMLGYVKHRLQEMSTRSTVHSHHCEHLINSLCIVKSLYILNKDFAIEIGFTDYHTRKEQVLEGYVKTLCSDMQKNNLSVVSCYRKAARVANLLELEKMNAMSALLEEMKRCDLLKTFTERDQMNLNITMEECEYVHRICYTVLQNYDIDKDTLNVLKNMCSSALRTCCETQINETLFVKSWVDLYLQCLSNNIDPLSADSEKMQRSSWKLYSTYKDTCISPKSILLPVLRDAFKICTSSENPSEVQRGEDDEANEIFNPNEFEDLLAGEGAVDNLCRDLLGKVQNLQIEHTILSVVRLINLLYISSCTSTVVNGDTVTEIETVYHRMTKVLLRKLTTVRSLDMPLALSALFTLPDCEACNWLSTTFKTLQGDYARHSKLTLFAYEYCRLANYLTIAEPYIGHKMLHYWADKLSVLSIPYKDVLVADSEGKRQIVERIIRSNNENTINLIHEYCGSFGLNIDESLMTYLRILLKTWDPTLKIVQSGRKKELHINEDEIAELRRKCNMIVEKIHDKVALSKFIRSLWSQVNFYLYEVFLVIMDLMDDTNSDTRSTFYFLQNYTRTSKPTQVERDEWMHLSPENTTLPAISEWRLPYLLADNQWKIITPELNLRTYETWLDVAPVLKLQNHVICTLAIKEEVSQTWENMRATARGSQWSIYPRNSDLLENIMKCLSRMTGPGAAYYATAALYFVVTHTPPGADQVAAAQECYKYAQQAAEQLTQYEEGLLEKIHFKYLKFTSEHILHNYELATEMYLSKLSTPETLVRSLYLDDSIIRRYRSITDYKPNINAAVDDLCELFCLNNMKLRLELLDEWLRPTVNPSQMNSSFTDTVPLNADNLDYSLINDDNLIRACYLLESGDVEKSANFLINIGFGDDEKYGPGARCRALYVLQSITDSETIEELTKRDLPTIRRHMKTLEYLFDLSHLGYEYTPQMFAECSKLELATIITETQSFSPRAMAFVSELCLEYEIYDDLLWNNVLLQMAKFKMIGELKKLVLKLQSLGPVVNSAGYVAAWQAVLTEPFRKLQLNPTKGQLNDCIFALRLVHSCPVVPEVSFNDIIDYCFQCGQPHFAAGFLLFLSHDTRKRLLQRLAANAEIPNIITALYELIARGVIAVTHCIAIIEDMYR